MIRKNLEETKKSEIQIPDTKKVLESIKDLNKLDNLSKTDINKTTNLFKL